MFEKFVKAVKRYEEIERILNSSDIAANPGQMSSLLKEMGILSKQVAAYREWERIHKKLEEAKQLAASGADPELAQLAREEIATLQDTYDKLKKQLEDMMLDEDSEKYRDGVIVEIRAGVGGEEANLFAADLFRMYSKYIEKKGWKMELLDITYSDLKGIKEVVFSVENPEAFAFLKFESGTHRVQRVPATEASGRIHTSAATVAVLPQGGDVQIDIKDEDVIVETCRSGGPGGQHVNRTDSAVRLTHKTSGIVVKIQTQRSQHRNRDLAFQVLKARLSELYEDKSRAERTQMRKSQIGTGDRSEKIRTYNFPQSRITDHRINFSVHQLQEFLDGNIDEMVAKLREAEREKKLQMLRSASAQQ